MWQLTEFIPETVKTNLSVVKSELKGFSSSQRLKLSTLDTVEQWVASADRGIQITVWPKQQAWPWIIQHSFMKVTGRGMSSWNPAHHTERGIQDDGQEGTESMPLGRSTDNICWGSQWAFWRLHLLSGTLCQDELHALGFCTATLCRLFSDARHNVDPGPISWPETSHPVI